MAIGANAGTWSAKCLGPSTKCVGVGGEQAELLRFQVLGTHRAGLREPVGGSVGARGGMLEVAGQGAARLRLDNLDPRVRAGEVLAEALLQGLLQGGDQEH